MIVQELTRDDISHTPSKFDVLSNISLFLICPSFRKECGIGRHTVQMSEALKSYFSKITLFETVFDASQHPDVQNGKALVLFQHEYSLVDFRSPLASFETTADVISTLRRISNYGSKVGIIMHTVVMEDAAAELANKQIISSQIPVFTTTRSGASSLRINFVDLGVPTQEVNSKKANLHFCISEKEDIINSEIESIDDDKILVCSFGFLSQNKDIESVLQLCAQSKSQIHANFSSKNEGDQLAVLSRAEELGVFGRITFDFLDDATLIQFIDQASVVYLPQHDFGHFSTSATARLALALGKLVIAPPHSPFHDLASAVQFADLQKAVAILNGLQRHPDRIEELRRPGLLLAEQTEMGVVYADLARKILRGEVWCGGNLFSPHTTKAESLDHVIQHYGIEKTLSPQNIFGIENTGFGFANGEMIELGLFDQTDLKFESRLVTSRVDCFDKILSLEREFRLIQSAKSKSDWLYEMLDSVYSKNILRDIRGLPSTYFAVLELLELPSFAQAILFIQELKLSVDAVANYFSNAALLRERAEINHEFAGSELFELTAFQNLVASVPASKSQLLWGKPVIPNSADMRKFIFPGTIMAHENRECIRALYSVLLHRGVDATGMASHMERLQKGISKSELAWDIAESPEAKNSRTRLAYDYNYWERRECLISSSLALHGAIASSVEGLKQYNVEYIQRVRNGRI